MTQDQCDNCADVENISIELLTIKNYTNKTCKEAAEETYKKSPDVICEDFKQKEVE